jgi:tetratricopeptide (TPR) repeat protein
MKDKTVSLIGTVLMISIPILFSCASNHLVKSKQAEAYFDLGTKHLQQGEYDQAISGYNKALEINPRYAEAYLNRGIAYRNKGQHDQAVSDYGMVLQINPKDARAFCNRGNIFIEKGQYDKAISDYNQALEINSKDAQVFYNRGVAYYFKCLEDIKKAQELGYKIPPDFFDDLRKTSGRKN